MPVQAYLDLKVLIIKQLYLYAECLFLSMCKLLIFSVLKINAFWNCVTY